MCGGAGVRLFVNALATLTIAALIGAFTPVRGFAIDQSGSQTQKSKRPVGEFFAGGALTKNSWISWAGVVKSLSSNLYQDGWRLRLLGAYGRYGFETNGHPNYANPALFEITPGYQFKTGPLISKVFVGLHGEQHKLANPDPNNKAQDMGYGAKIISENWIDLPMNSFASLDASFSSLNISYQGTLRAGSAYFCQQLTLGPELQIVGNREYYQLRAGLIARWKRPDGSWEASGGYSRDYDDKSTPYMSVSWLKQF